MKLILEDCLTSISGGRSRKKSSLDSDSKLKADGSIKGTKVGTVDLIGSIVVGLLVLCCQQSRADHQDDNQYPF